MSASPNQYVTLVSGGGTPVRLSDQRGSPYPTTGNGALVFSNNPTISNPQYTGVYLFDKGTAIDPIIAFAPVTDKDGFFSRGTGHVNVTIDGVERADFNAFGFAVAGNISATNITYSGTLTGAYHSPLTANGDIYYRSAGTDARLPLGAAGTMLFSSGTAAQWSPVGDIVPIDDYLPLAGGTLTGALSGTTAAFSGAVTSVGLSGTTASFSGEITALTPVDANDNDTTVATTAWVTAKGYATTSGVSGSYLPLAGGTLTGALTGTTAAFTGSVTTNADLILSEPAGNSRILYYQTAGVRRWGVLADNTAEAGSNVGSDFAINCYDDSGNYLNTPMLINRQFAITTFALAKVSGVIAPSSNDTTVPTTAWVKANAGLLQTVSTQTGAAATGTTTIPFDDTIPQITEGDEYMTLAITPRSATSKLVIEVIWCGSISSGANAVAVVLCQDAIANSLAATFTVPPFALAPMTLPLRHTMTSGTTSTITFRVRAGCNVAGTTTFNGQSGTRIFGGVAASSIVIQEVAV